ncbi:uncharacterized protein [Dysidea avara]|uniref:uncharacterized protein n=1 Tax=Dysidea avara TaxID=196820 RepID=UPI0033335CDD
MSQQATESEYQSTLDYDAKKRYKEKLILKSEQIPDPYAVPDEEWRDDVTEWPTVLYGDVYNYLIESKGRYTQESLRAFKSLEAYNYFISGHVRTVLFYEPSRQSKFCILVAEVNPSQKSPSETHKAWIIVQKEDGQVMTGHCTCKAGRGEVCSHVAAILFKVETACRLVYNNPTCTSMPCQWNQSFATNVDPALVVDINFIKPDHNKRNESVPCSSAATSQSSGLQILQQPEADVCSLYQALQVVVPGACIFTSISEESEVDVNSTTTAVTCRPQPDDASVTMATVSDRQCDHVNDLSSGTPDDGSVPVLMVNSTGDEVAEDQAEHVGNSGSSNEDLMPAPLTALHQAEYEQMDDEELLKEAERLFCEMSISNIEADAIRDATVAQHDCVAWTQHQNGRLTASLFHDVFVRKPTTNPELLVKKIMGYEQNDLSHIPAIRWGVQNESVARVQYASIMSAEHNNFTCNLTGLWINSLYPHLGVSPDGVTSCSCHGQGLLEIKCPYSARNAEFLTSETCCFLTDAGYLNKKHRYYTQIQGQLMISGLLFCDLFVWTPSVCKVERIYPSVRFWEKLEKRLTMFFITNVLPEIMTHKLQQSVENDSDSDKENIYCVCQKGSAGRMIACDNQQCHFKWFHYKCVGIKRAPKGTWLCSACKKSK